VTRRLSKHAKDRIRELYAEQKLEVRQIADLYGVNRWTVHSVCRDLVETHPVKMTDEMITQLQQLHADGVPGAAARTVGVSRKTVYRYW
jgi:DNA-binding XRE family transcriptional regulator